MSQPDDWRPYFATTATGLERTLERELRALGMGGVRRAGGGVSFRGPRAAMMAACLELRTASRVLWELGRFDAPHADALYDGVRRAARWRGFIPPSHSFAVDATARDNPQLRDSRYVARVVKDAIVDAVRDTDGGRPTVSLDDPDVRVAIRVVGRRAFLALDASGRGLHQRGYRAAAGGGEAPLRETLAAAVVLASGFHGERRLLDPACGSGTLTVEAALVATRTAPGLMGGPFGFERWPGFRSKAWREMKRAAEARIVPADTDETPPIHARDVDAKAIGRTRRALEAAGVLHAVHLERAPMDLLRPWPEEGPRGERPGVVLANPPWGERLGDIQTAKDVYRDLGRRMNEHFPGWDAWILAPRPELVGALGLPIAETRTMKAGPLTVKLVHAELGARA